MRRLALVLLLAASFLPLSAGRAWACSCAPATTSLSEQAAAYDVIFTGRAIDVFVDNGALVATYDLETIYRGPVAPTAVVRTSEQESACGYGIEVGDRDTIFAYRDGGLWVHTCGLSSRGSIRPARYSLTATPAPPPKDVVPTESIAPPEGDEAPPVVAGEQTPGASAGPWVAAGVGLVAAVLVVLITLRRARGSR